VANAFPELTLTASRIVLRSVGFVHAGRVDLAVYSKINADLEH
jgi:hypothetical protein